MRRLFTSTPAMLACLLLISCGGTYSEDDSFQAYSGETERFYVPPGVELPAGVTPINGEATSRAVAETGPKKTMLSGCTDDHDVKEKEATFTLSENIGSVDTGFDVENNRRIVIRCKDTIWAGVAFTGENDADGWKGWSAGSTFPLPGVPPYSVLERRNDNYNYAGVNHETIHCNGTTRLFLKINDDVHGNGSKSFTCTVTIFK